MENTEINKGKFMALYWGQKVLFRKDLFNQLYNVSQHFNLGHDNLCLELTPLSQITDKDALNVAAIFGTHSYLYRPKIRYVGNNEFAQLYYVNEHKEGGETGMDNWTIVANFSSDGISVLKSNRDLIYLKAYDYLRSKGYALPFMGLSVEELVAFGWVKLKQI